MALTNFTCSLDTLRPVSVLPRANLRVETNYIQYHHYILGIQTRFISRGDRAMELVISKLQGSLYDGVRRYLERFPKLLSCETQRELRVYTYQTQEGT